MHIVKQLAAFPQSQALEKCGVYDLYNLYCWALPLQTANTT